VMLVRHCICNTNVAYSEAMHFTVLPSLLAADPGHLAREAKRAEDSGADALHLDIMDGHFVPNISMGPSVVAMAKRNVSIPLNVHLMLTHPDRYVDAFAKAGSDTLHIHIEAACDVPATLEKIRATGMKPGITINPDTDPALIYPVLSLVEEVLVMTVRPGYGGQAFMPGPVASIRSIRSFCVQDSKQANMTIMVDGGINAETALICAEAGANAFVAGSYLYGSDNMPALVEQMRNNTADTYSKYWSSLHD
jgi:ribulose-phosphate 3-epimerase